MSMRWKVKKYYLNLFASHMTSSRAGASSNAWGIWAYVITQSFKSVSICNSKPKPMTLYGLGSTNIAAYTAIA